MNPFSIPSNRMTRRPIALLFFTCVLALGANNAADAREWRGFGYRHAAYGPRFFPYLRPAPYPVYAQPQTYYVVPPPAQTYYYALPPQRQAVNLPPPPPPPPASYSPANDVGPAPDPSPAQPPPSGLSLRDLP